MRITNYRFIVFGLILLVFSGAASAKVIRVKSGSTGANTGTSWVDAFPNLQSALTSSTLGDEIWVAAGTYKPTGGTDRTKVITVSKTVGIYGGFAGTETTLAQRDYVAHRTILSGDIGVQGVSSDNSHQIISFAYHRITLDGFTIRDGYSSVGFSAAVMNAGTSVTIANCTISQNYSVAPGAVLNSGNALTMTHCTFTSNSTFNWGGAIHNDGNRCSITGCAFIGNVAHFTGGAIDNEGTSQTIVNCTFIGNKATSREGGAINNGGDYQKVINCTFDGNQAAVGGGAIYTVGVNPTVSSCTFSNNTSQYGGAIFAFGVSLINCTMSGNSAGTGGAIYFNGVAPETVQTIVNCILWGNSASNGPEISKFWRCIPAYRNCDIKGGGGSGLAWTTAFGTDLGGNIAVDPRFAAPTNPAGPDGIWRTTDDGLRLQTGSPCINTGTSGGASASDILGGNRYGIPDIGAYEFQGPGPRNAARYWSPYR